MTYDFPPKRNVTRAGPQYLTYFATPAMRAVRRRGWTHHSVRDGLRLCQPLWHYSRRTFEFETTPDHAPARSLLHGADDGEKTQSLAVAKLLLS
jgi:hypothetical protein